MNRHTFVERTLQRFAKALSHAIISEESAKLPGLMQSIDPRVSVFGTLVLIVAVAFCRNIPLLATCFAGSVLLALATRISLWSLAKRVWLIVFGFAGLIAFPALFTVPGPPLIEFPALSLRISEPGLRSALYLLLRVETAATLTTVLILSKPWTHVLKSLRSFRIPVEVVAILAMTHRYIFLLIETANHMFESRQSRVVGALTGEQQRGLAVRTAGVLLSKSIDMSDQVYLAMQSRGYRGEVQIVHDFKMRPADYFAIGMFVACSILIFWFGR